MSVVPPVAKGMMRVIGFVGQSGSAERADSPSVASEQNAITRDIARVN